LRSGFVSRTQYAGGSVGYVNLDRYSGTKKMTEITSNEMWIITAAVTAAACIFVAYLLHRAGDILREQDKCTEQRDTQSNYEYWNEENWDD
jgi:hypothetical protein